MTHLEIDAENPNHNEAQVIAEVEYAASQGLPLKLTYGDTKGNVTERLVSPERVYRSKAGDLLIFGTCHLRKEGRSFRGDAIIEITTEVN